jgi:flagellar protein FlbD
VITLSRLNGQVVAINPDLITWIEVTPDTVISLVGGEKIMVRERLEEVIGQVIEFRRAIGASHGLDGVLERLSRPPSERPPSAGASRRSSAPPGTWHGPATTGASTGRK